MSMLLGGLLAFASAGFIAASDFISGLLTRRYSPFLVLGVSMSISGVIVLAILARTSGISMDGRVIVAGFIAGTMLLTSQALYYVALSQGVLGVVGGIATVFVIVPVGYAFLAGDSPTALGIIGIVTIVGGVVALSLPDPGYCPMGRPRRTSMAIVGIALASGLIRGLQLVLVGHGSMFDPESTVLLEYSVAPLAIAIAIIASRRGRDRESSGPRMRWWLLGSALLGAALFALFSDMTFAWSTVITNEAVAATISGLDPVFLAVFGLIFLREKLSRAQFLGLAATMIGGTLALSG